MGLIWSVIVTVSGLLLAVAVSTVARILADDGKEWLPWLTRHLVERAVQRLPEGERERFAEEWWSHINDWPGNIAKLYVALGYLSASRSIRNIVLFETGLRVSSPRGEFLRRASDVSLATVLLVSLSPIMLLLILCIKFDSSGPAMFSDLCVGQNGKSFRLLRFRCSHCEGDDISAPGCFQKNQLTRVGKFIRIFSFDELPQLINVLRGDMSLIGPRALPEIDATTVSLIREITPEYNHIPVVRPGITGWAQLMLYKSKADTINFLRLSFLYDQHYIGRRCFRFDLKIYLILFRTIFSQWKD